MLALSDLHVLGEAGSADIVSACLKQGEQRTALEEVARDEAGALAQGSLVRLLAPQLAGPVNHLQYYTRAYPRIPAVPCSPDWYCHTQRSHMRHSRSTALSAGDCCCMGLLP